MDTIQFNCDLSSVETDNGSRIVPDLWPKEFTPTITKTNNPVTFLGRFKNDSLGLLHFFTTPRKSFVFMWLSENSYLEFEVLSIEEQKIKIKGTLYENSSEEYILCENYSLINGVLSFSGGDFPNFSNTDWHLLP